MTNLQLNTKACVTILQSSREGLDGQLLSMKEACRLWKESYNPQAAVYPTHIQIAFSDNTHYYALLPLGKDASFMEALRQKEVEREDTLFGMDNDVKEQIFNSLYNAYDWESIQECRQEIQKILQEGNPNWKTEVEQYEKLIDFYESVICQRNSV